MLHIKRNWSTEFVSPEHKFPNHFAPDYRWAETAKKRKQNLLGILNKHLPFFVVPNYARFSILIPPSFHTVLEAFWLTLQ